MSGMISGTIPGTFSAESVLAAEAASEAEVFAAQVSEAGVSEAEAFGEEASAAEITASFAKPQILSPSSRSPEKSSARMGVPVSTAFFPGSFSIVSGKLQQIFAAAL